MDKSEKYIEMCRETWKYLKREVELDDVVAYRYTYEGYIGEGVDYFFHIAEKWMIKEDCEDTYIFIVWKQDQLQGMLDEKDPMDSLQTFYEELYFEPEMMSEKRPSGYWLPKRYYEQFDSMEQLRLAFMMKRKFSKEWQNDQWIKIP